ncbi:hypothetical protein FF36_01596 [Frankia torreyi]|uniref:Uncharacterized protein n=1 Tax=Frankia torreyi TaxID=1856 RepID=A0A0D8BIU9_9ACTN|nr:hypothetical protein FF36_01596 [Frankia torreyi]KQM06110.1 hypothetical protein FF86_1011135 [Frankia sp. CpI1-P]
MAAALHGARLSARRPSSRQRHARAGPTSRPAHPVGTAPVRWPDRSGRSTGSADLRSLRLAVAAGSARRPTPDRSGRAGRPDRLPPARATGSPGSARRPGRTTRSALLRSTDQARFHPTRHGRGARDVHARPPAGRLSREPHLAGRSRLHGTAVPRRPRSRPRTSLRPWRTGPCRRSARARSRWRGPALGGRQRPRLPSDPTRLDLPRTPRRPAARRPPARARPPGKRSWGAPGRRRRHGLSRAVRGSRWGHRTHRRRPRHAGRPRPRPGGAQRCRDGGS